MTSQTPSDCLFCKIVAVGRDVADAHRMIVNTGSGAGQTVFHAHVHLLAGAAFTEGRMV